MSVACFSLCPTVPFDFDRTSLLYALPLRRDGFWPKRIGYYSTLYLHWYVYTYTPRYIHSLTSGCMVSYLRELGEFIPFLLFWSEGLWARMFPKLIRTTGSKDKREKKGYVPRCSPQHLSLSNGKSHVKRIDSFYSSFFFFFFFFPF